MEVSTVGAATTARLALERVHAAKSQFILHFDVDTINGEEFPWTNSPGTGGLGMNEVRDALRVFVSQPNLVAFEVAGYNPDVDPDGKGALKLIDLLADVLSARLEAATPAAAGAEEASPAPSVSSAPSSDVAPTAMRSPAEPAEEVHHSTPAESPDATDPDEAIS
jgi:hypothetical protein